MPASFRAFRAVVLGVIVVLGGWLPTSRADSPSGLWREVDEKPLLAARGVSAETARGGVVPRQHRTLTLYHTRLSALLDAAPEEGVLRKALAEGAPAEALPAPVEIDLPMPHSAAFERFSVESSPVMEPGLAARFPEIRTYVAQGIDNPRLTARLDMTPRGFHALIRSTAGQIVIDPYFADGSDQETTVAYFKRDYPRTAPWSCSVDDAHNLLSKAVTDAVPPTTAATGNTLRVYRLAVGTTAEYSAAVGGSNVTQTLAAVVTVVNRVDALYERDLAIRMVLINNEDQLIYTNAGTEPYTNNNANGVLLSQNQTVCDNVIGTANYDIGHVFSTAGGGLAYQGVVCYPGYKAGGETGISNPVGDPYAIDYVAHEMGHQFGAGHTFNSSTGSCSGNIDPAHSYEPGSGVTIMAYAGICSNGSNVQDLARDSDDYFHGTSYDQIVAYTTTDTGNNTVLPKISTGNHPPTVAAQTAYTIPISTPFALTASATDPDGDSLTYCWEEFDLGDPVNASTVGGLDNGASPIFRSYAPTANPTRTFPSLTYILNNANVPPLRGSSGYLVGEALPSVARPNGLNFRCTVRDNRAGGGGSQFAAVQLAVATGAGPFAITAPNSSGTYAAGASVPITWNVANTTASPVACANVKITLSTDGGLTFPYTLASSAPNSGSATITLPTAASVATRQGRIKVEAVGNIFFDVDDANLIITSTNTPPTFAASGSGVNIVRGTPTAVSGTVGTATPGSNPLASASVSGVPDGASVTASLSGNNVVLTATAACRLTTTLGTRAYPINVTVTDTAGATVSGAASLVIAPNPSPTLGAYANTGVPAGSAVTVSPASVAADPNGNLPASPYSLIATVPSGMTLAVNQMTGAVTATTTTGTAQGAVPVRVTVLDSCGAAVVQTFTLTVAAPPATSAPAFTSAAQSGTTFVGAPYQFTFAASGSPAPTFSVTSGTLPTGLSLNATTGVLAGTPTVVGVTQNIQITASNGVAPTATQTFALTVFNTLSNYLAGYGLSGANAAPTADPDNDGLANLTEYALNLVPNASDAGNALLPSKQAVVRAYSGGNYLSIRFTRVPLAADISYFVETSPDLTSWTTVASSVGGAALSGPGVVSDDASNTGPHTVEARDTVAQQTGVAGDRRFLRLKVTKP